MLNIVFCLLLAANGFLFAYHQGYLESILPSGREPARMRNQINADKIRLLGQAAPRAAAPAAGVTQAVAAPGNAPVAATNDASREAARTDVGVAAQGAAANTAAGTQLPAAAVVQVAAAAPAPAKDNKESKESKPACTEIGNFTTAEANRFEERLTSLSLGGKFARREVKESSTHMVFIPPQEGKEGADRKVAELRRLGVNDYFVIQDNPAQRWGISLGIFRTEEAARAHLDMLKRKGVRSAQLVDHRVPLSRVAFQLKGLPRNGEMEKIRAGFPRQEMRECA